MNENNAPAQPVPEPPPSDPAPGSASLKTWIVAGAVTAACVLGAGYMLTQGGDDATATTGQPNDTAAAGNGAPGGFNGPPGGFGVNGEITELDGATLVVASANPRTGETTEVTVTTSDDVSVTEAVDGTVSDIAIGNNVTVIAAEGDDSGDGAVVAASVVDSGDQDAGLPGGRFPGGGGTPPSAPEGQTPPSLPEGQARPEMPEGGGPGGGRGPGGFTGGEVTAVAGEVITIETASGDTIEVTTTPETAVTVTREIGLADLAVGDTVSVTPTDRDDSGDDGTVEAGSIRRGDLLGGMGGRFGQAGAAADDGA